MGENYMGKKHSQIFLSSVSGVRIAAGIFLITIMLHPILLSIAPKRSTIVIARLTKRSGGGEEGKAQLSDFLFGQVSFYVFLSGQLSFFAQRKSPVPLLPLLPL